MLNNIFLLPYKLHWLINVTKLLTTGPIIAIPEVGDDFDNFDDDNFNSDDNFNGYYIEDIDL